ncbi:uncharacterized protein ASPGLDRAFT_42322 [Aspergillus glaucus CBS 516.65]|uniref:Uncharacterized protein n=1 Tax=Aspergillus glaucus CBS 516.65 TaxID=1160497 RepID=A0A1L9VXW2_ASPGL|nr:hypothetical protein ASPGLDRAFT_42322 [Aspergillus glaucus CBS 516.65]OJJ88742.1 hypothetical protein ASPGLDRAFT_42322 [Aspergillus glaucus CBS 516.65]
MHENALDPYADSKDMLDHLKTIYSDPNCVTCHGAWTLVSYIACPITLTRLA